MPHVALLGDSILDNASYVDSDSAVIDHLRQLLPREWDASLLATDGATTSVVHKQIERLPKTVTHIVLSAGGNDALWMSGNLYQESTDDIRDSLGKLGKQCAEFKTGYSKLIDRLQSLRMPVAVCYDL